MKNKNAISGVVTMVVLVALTLIAVGVVWAVVGNLIGSKTEQINLQADCLAVEIEITSASCAGSNCDISINRKAGGKPFDGLKIVFKDALVSGEILDYLNNIDPLATISQNYPNVGVSAPIEVDVAVYFLDKSGEELICPTVKNKVL